MARPFVKQSVTGATATGAGTELKGLGNTTFGMFVSATNPDTTNDTLEVRIEVSHDSTEWASVEDMDNAVAGVITQNELNASGNAFVIMRGVAAPFIRANVTAFTDASDSGTTPTADLAVDAYIHAAGYGGPAHDFIIE